MDLRSEIQNASPYRVTAIHHVSYIYKAHHFSPLRQLSPYMKAASSSPSSSSNRVMPHNPPRKPQYPNDLLNPESFKHFERALAQQYAREYLSKHNPNKSPNQIFRPRFAPHSLLSLRSPHIPSLILQNGPLRRSGLADRHGLSRAPWDKTWRCRNSVARRQTDSLRKTVGATVTRTKRQISCPRIEVRFIPEEYQSSGGRSGRFSFRDSS